MSWNPVTDTGGSAPAEPDSPGFEFDLGGALARLGGDEAPDAPEATEAPAPTPAPPSSSAPPTPAPPAAPEPITPAAPVAPAPDLDTPMPGTSPGAEPVRSLDDLFPVSDHDLATPAVTPPATPPAAPAAAEPPAAPSPVAEAPVTPPPTATPRAVSSLEGLLPTRGAGDQPALDSTLPTRLNTSAPTSSVFDTDVPTTAPTAPAPAAPAPVDSPDAVPEIREATPPDAASSMRATSQRSVFDSETTAAAPTLPGASTAPAPAPAPARPRPTPSSPVDHAAQTDAALGLPTLPESAPGAPPPMSAPIDTAPNTPDVHALRSAQLRAQKNQRSGAMFGRGLLAFVVIGGLIAAALVFGRAYLFPKEWDAALTPIVDQIEIEQGVVFDETVPLVVQPTSEYAGSVLGQTVGTDWTADAAAWRALGLATGDLTAQDVARGVAEQRPVVYDESSDTIYQWADADPASLDDEYRLALQRALAVQRGTSVDGDASAPRGLAGVSATADIARRAVDSYLVTAGSRPADGDGEVAEDALALPLPIAYELAAVDSLGEAVLVAAGVDPSTLTPGDPYPAGIADVLGDDPVGTASGLLRPGETSLGDPVALGVDDWSLVWGARLPGTTVDRLVDEVTADSYRVVDRGGVTCFIGVFQTANETGGSQVYSSMLRWAGAAPEGSQAVATLLGPTRVQLEACDPGVEVTSLPDPASVDALLNRQIDRLAS